MPDIFDEVAEDLRAARLQAALRRYGVFGIALLVLVVAGTGGWELWQQRRHRQDEAMAMQFLAATKAAGGTPAERSQAAGELAAIEQRAPAGYAALAGLRLAALKASEGDSAGAARAYDTIAADTNAPRLLRDLATLRSVQALLATGDPATLKSRLATIETPASAWRPAAQETEAMVDLRTGDSRAAIGLLQQVVSDVTAPGGTRARANGLLQSLGVQTRTGNAE